MRKEISPLLVVVVIAVVAVVLIGGFTYFSNPHPPFGVKYTPGVPPWMEKGANAAKSAPASPPPGTMIPPPGKGGSG
jgi:hypothetical protein